MIEEMVIEIPPIEDRVSFHSLNSISKDYDLHDERKLVSIKGRHILRTKQIKIILTVVSYLERKAIKLDTDYPRGR